MSLRKKIRETGRKRCVFKSSLYFREEKLISHIVDAKIYDLTEEGVFDTSHLGPILHRLINEKI